MQASCLTHNVRQVTLPLAPDDERFKHVLRVDREEDKYRKGKPHCGSSCYLLRPRDVSKEKIAWTPSERAELRMMLQLDSGMSPCDLSVLCRKPCREIPAMREILAPWHAQNANSRLATPADASEDASIHEYKDTYASQFAPLNDLCDHVGPCTAQTRCACFLNKSHCSRSCRCSPKCGRRWTGCQCGRKGDGKNRRSCLTQACPCRRASRECDPELCTPCYEPVREARFPGRLGSSSNGARSLQCRNCQIQLGCRKSLKLKHNESTVGVFLVESAKEGDLIAELIYETTSEARVHLARDGERDGVYNLNQSFDIDGAYAGNETRFINSAPAAKATGRLATFMVNGDHRIGVFARKNIPAGAELTLA
ncbi:uncharacterized protein C8Q71DRAFT_911440 [Rhodofomes roseus]|uniref:SET domain-containing protein n=1 Tax=Rhodofomes roseus TaxID=34475 RepID=A0ABQ8K1G1_9APHY|nr:uncharacterized protein C8Q71DRAFT_911440 [Rhodofomes roseus]KAH9830084.1 hypothetical protein C8Q71DRAFT_911440 [Rhodofomes roseus]